MMRSRKLISTVRQEADIDGLTQCFNANADQLGQVSESRAGNKSSCIGPTIRISRAGLLWQSQAAHERCRSNLLSTELQRCSAGLRLAVVDDIGCVKRPLVRIQDVKGGFADGFDLYVEGAAETA